MSLLDSRLIRQIETIKPKLRINEYSLAQTTLEQIFLHFARQQDEEKNTAEGFKGTQGLAATPVPEGDVKEL
jgi:hypothetical protein